MDSDREARLLAFCRTYQGESSAHNLIKRLDVLLSAQRPLVEAATSDNLIVAVEWFMGEFTSIRAMPPAARAAFHAFFEAARAYRPAQEGSDAT
jgi:hypothetical protein